MDLARYVRRASKKFETCIVFVRCLVAASLSWPRPWGQAVHKVVAEHLHFFTHLVVAVVFTDPSSKGLVRYTLRQRLTQSWDIGVLPWTLDSKTPPDDSEQRQKQLFNPRTNSRAWGAVSRGNRASAEPFSFCCEIIFTYSTSDEMEFFFSWHERTEVAARSWPSRLASCRRKRPAEGAALLCTCRPESAEGHSNNPRKPPATPLKHHSAPRIQLSWVLASSSQNGRVRVQFNHTNDPFA